MPNDGIYSGGMQYKRHPALVTSDRLENAYEKWNDKFTGEELVAISKVRHALQRISEGRDYDDD